jgi:hypothetical protein
MKTLKLIISGFNNPMFPITRSVRPLAKFFAAMAFVSVAISGFANPAADVLDETHAAVRAVMAVQDEITPDLMLQPEILGTAVANDATGVGVPVLTVYVDRAAANVREVMRNLPRQFRGISVQVELTDEIHPMYTGKQTPPIRLGTSGGWNDDSANGYCCSGTLGSLVWIGRTQYILSNAHVLEREIAQTGASIIQPGLVDVNCNGNVAQTVGTLVKKYSLSRSNVDCAIAKVRPGMVRTDGWILGIGTISRYLSAAAVNQHVKKSGRTSGLTRSHVSGLNATIRVSYDRECGGGVSGGESFGKTFYHQIVIANRSNSFLRPGDSGSLMVQDIPSNPRAIGLLFAGNDSIAVANPIGQVLNFLGATMVGN